jgi:hypothetical protein
MLTEDREWFCTLRALSSAYTYVNVSESFGNNKFWITFSNNSKQDLDEETFANEIIEGTLGDGIYGISDINRAMWRAIVGAGYITNEGDKTAPVQRLETAKFLKGGDRKEEGDDDFFPVQFVPNYATSHLRIVLDTAYGGWNVKMNDGLAELLGFEPGYGWYSHKPDESPLDGPYGAKIVSTSSYTINTNLVSEGTSFHQDGKRRQAIYSFMPDVAPGDFIIREVEKVDMFHMKSQTGPLQSVKVWLGNEYGRPIPSINGELLSITLHIIGFRKKDTNTEKLEKLMKKLLQ